MIEDVYSQTEERMTKSIEALRRELATIRTGRASTSLLDRISVDYYGTLTPLNQLASISAPEPRLIVIQPWDKSQIPSIEKAILSSDLGLPPTNDGKLIRLTIPPLTRERREELVKVVNGRAEEVRISIREARHVANESLKRMEKAKEISEDDSRHGKEQIQKITDKYIEEVDQILAAKEKEVLEV